MLLLIATLAYSVSLLRSLVLYGTNYTAPFSVLTFLTYCASLAPFLFILLLVLCTKQLIASERGAEAIISATPVPVHVFRLIRYSAIACVFILAAALPIAACFVFYRLLFDYTSVGVLLLPGLLLLVPSAILLFGVAILLGNRKSATVYVLLAVILIVSVFRISLPWFIDILGSSTDFVLTPTFYTGRVIISGIGILFIISSLFQSKKQRK